MPQKTLVGRWLAGCIALALGVSPLLACSAHTEPSPTPGKSTEADTFCADPMPECGTDATAVCDTDTGLWGCVYRAQTTGTCSTCKKWL